MKEGKEMVAITIAAMLAGKGPDILVVEHDRDGVAARTSRKATDMICDKSIMWNVFSEMIEADENEHELEKQRALASITRKKADLIVEEREGITGETSTTHLIEAITTVLDRGNCKVVLSYIENAGSEKVALEETTKQIETISAEVGDIGCVRRKGRNEDEVLAWFASQWYGTAVRLVESFEATQNDDGDLEERASEDQVEACAHVLWMAAANAALKAIAVRSYGGHLNTEDHMKLIKDVPAEIRGTMAEKCQVRYGVCMEKMVDEARKDLARMGPGRRSGDEKSNSGSAAMLSALTIEALEE